MARRPVELTADLHRVDGVSAVVPGPVGHVRLELAIARTGLQRGIGPGRMELLERVADAIDDLQVRSFVAATDVVPFTHAPFFENGQNPRAMIVDVQPIADVATVAVDRKRPAVQCRQDHQRNQLFRILKRTVVIRAVRHQRRQPVRMVVRAHQMIGGGLARRIRGIRRERGLLAEQPRRPERAVHLVGRDVQEPEGGACRRRELRHQLP
jgi:hypothetical protein